MKHVVRRALLLCALTSPLAAAIHTASAAAVPGADINFSCDRTTGGVINVQLTNTGDEPADFSITINGAQGGVVTVAAGDVNNGSLPGTEGTTYTVIVTSGAFTLTETETVDCYNATAVLQFTCSSAGPGLIAQIQNTGQSVITGELAAQGYVGASQNLDPGQETELENLLYEEDETTRRPLVTPARTEVSFSTSCQVSPTVK